MPFDKKAYMKKWYEDRPEYNKNYYIDNKEKIDEQNKKWSEEHEEELKKYRDEYKPRQKNCDILRRRDNKMKACEIIAKTHGTEIKCWRCSETRMWVLTIGHLNQDGYVDCKIHGRGDGLCRAIITGKRKCDDLHIECMSCNSCLEWYGKYPDEITEEYYLAEPGTKIKIKTFEKIAEYHNVEVKCFKCGEKRQWMLSLGHTNHDGVDDRKNHKGGAGIQYAIVKGTRGCEGLQIECMNCNCCRTWHGAYPDEIDEEEFKRGKI